MKHPKPCIDIAIPYKELTRMGILKGTVYFPKENPKTNYFGVKASLAVWPAGWILSDPKGWIQWWENYCNGRRHQDDAIQISRWQNFGRRHLNGLLQASVKENKTIHNRAFWTKAKQALLHWAIHPEQPQFYTAFCGDIMAGMNQERLAALGFIGQKQQN